MALAQRRTQGTGDRLGRQHLPGLNPAPGARRSLRSTFTRCSLLGASAALLLASCAGGKRWVNDSPDEPRRSNVKLVDDRPGQNGSGESREVRTIGGEPDELSDSELADAPGNRPELRLEGSGAIADGPADGKLLGVFRNTYYDFPAESDFSGAATQLMNRDCKPITEVPRGFYEAVCVQGSGMLENGTTVSFSRRDCSCALSCERTGQKICFDALDQRQFPFGRGALGKPITPLRSVAVDSGVIPLGTHIYILEYDGVPRAPGGAPHDGCFIAEDRGMKVVGQHVDIFTGNARVTTHMNGAVPSNRGVHVYVDTSRCKTL